VSCACVLRARVAQAYDQVCIALGGVFRHSFPLYRGREWVSNGFVFGWGSRGIARHAPTYRILAQNVPLLS
jgi:hypothetical protein